jgi:hypothetical protein
VFPKAPVDAGAEGGAIDASDRVDASDASTGDALFDDALLDDASTAADTYLVPCPYPSSTCIDGGVDGG